MKKYIRVVLVVIVLSFIFSFLFSIFSSDKKVNYTIDDKVIFEHYIKDTNSYYYFEIAFNNNIFNFKVSNNYNRDSYIIDDIYTFENDLYTCIFPLFYKGNIETDILCMKDNIIYPYRSIKNTNLELDKFASEMEEYGYAVDNNDDDYIVSSNLKVFTGNFSDILLLPSYKGIYVIDSSKNEVISSIDLFRKDIYSQPIQAIVSNYYLVADYNEEYSFHNFYLVNLKNNKVSTIASNSSISHNSYVQGTVDNCVYIIDCSNKKQYKIDVTNRTITTVGNKEKGIIYYDNGEFVNKSIYDALNSNLIFKNNYVKSDKYDYVYNNNGTYYSYLKTKNGYDVYISYDYNPELYTYAFNINSFENVYYRDNSIYYVDGDNIFNYSLATGKVNILNYSELIYNDSLSFFIYEK